MNQMTNQEKIEKIKKFQACDHVHQLTCIKSKHKPLIPKEEDGKVILVCEECAYRQSHVPDVVFKVSDEFLMSDPAAMLKKISEGES